MSKYVMALDQGTTSSRAIIFDEHQNIVNMAQKEFTQHYPKAGWVEHDPLEIYASQYGVLVEVLARRKGAYRMSKYVMALDQGTTSSRAIIFDEHQNIVNMAQDRKSVV